MGGALRTACGIPVVQWQGQTHTPSPVTLALAPTATRAHLIRSLPSVRGKVVGSIACRDEAGPQLFRCENVLHVEAVGAAAAAACGSGVAAAAAATHRWLRVQGEGGQEPWYTLFDSRQAGNAQEPWYTLFDSRQAGNAQATQYCRAPSESPPPCPPLPLPLPYRGHTPKHK